MPVQSGGRALLSRGQSSLRVGSEKPRRPEIPTPSQAPRIRAPTRSAQPRSAGGGEKRERRAACERIVLVRAAANRNAPRSAVQCFHPAERHAAAHVAAVGTLRSDEFPGTELPITVKTQTLAVPPMPQFS